jgi:hypothetical protein
MDEKRRCDTCNVEISKTNWSKHIKTKKHLAGISDSTRREVNERSDEGVEIKRCGICNVVVPENEWTNHLKSPSHKRSTKSIKDKLKEKVRSFNIRRQRKRNFQDKDFEKNDYIVKKSEEALEGCFLTLRITPKNEVNSV